jgi:hypothetical protein
MIPGDEVITDLIQINQWTKVYRSTKQRGLKYIILEVEIL